MLDAHRDGERHRRCARFSHTPLADVLGRLNAVLDAASAPTAPSSSAAAEVTRLRTAVVGLLDLDGHALVLWDPNGAGADGELVAASDRAHDLLAEDAGRLVSIRDGTYAPVERFDGPSGPVWLFRLDAGPVAPG